MNTEIYLVRHGESLANLEHKLAGVRDVPLSGLGALQAQATAEALSGVRFDAVYSSDLSRAYNTALPHAQRRGLDVVVVGELREMNLGEWEGMTVPDIIDLYGAESYKGGWQDSFGTFRAPGGESTQECAERVYSAIKKIACENPGARILIVSHGAALRTFWARISGIAPRDIAHSLPYQSNASYSRADFDGEKFTPAEFSVDRHLASVGITKVDW